MKNNYLKLVGPSTPYDALVPVDDRDSVDVARAVTALSEQFPLVAGAPWRMVCWKRRGLLAGYKEVCGL